MQSRGGTTSTKRGLGGVGLTILSFCLFFLEKGWEARGVVLTPAQGTTLLWLAAACFVVGIGLIAWAWLGWVWAQAKRLWPFALARTVRHLRSELREARNRNEQLDQLNQNLEAEGETVSNALQLEKRENAALKLQHQRPIELGDTARLFLTDGARFVPDDDAERRTIFLPALLEHWAGPLSSAVESGKTFVATETEFDKCDIYGPGVLVLADGSFEDTFHKCDWEEEWQAFWPATKPGRYVGAIALRNCKFKWCTFKGVSFVVKPDEYRRLYRRFTGDDL
jgi:hypothetical protein